MKDQSGVRWTQLPLFGAVGAGRSDELPAAPEGFIPTPSGQAEQDNWYARNGFPPGTFTEEVPGAGPELPG